MPVLAAGGAANEGGILSNSSAVRTGAKLTDRLFVRPTGRLARVLQSPSAPLLAMRTVQGSAPCTERPMALP